MRRDDFPSLLAQHVAEFQERIIALDEAIERGRAYLDQAHVRIQPLLDLIFAVIDERERAYRRAEAALVGARAGLIAECGNQTMIDELLVHARAKWAVAYETEATLRGILATRLLDAPTKAMS